MFVRTKECSMGSPWIRTLLLASTNLDFLYSCGAILTISTSYFDITTVHTRACAVGCYFVFLLYILLNACSVKFGGSYYDDKVIWTGLCSRTFGRVWVLECLVSRHLANLSLVLWHPSHQHRGRLLHVPSQLGVRRRTRIVLDGIDFKGSLLDWYQRCVDGERGGQRSGQLLLHDGQDGERGEGQAWIKTRITVTSSDPVPVICPMCTFMFLPSKLPIRLCWFVPEDANYIMSLVS